jgi:hypothetical protein
VEDRGAAKHDVVVEVVELRLDRVDELRDREASLLAELLQGYRHPAVATDEQCGGRMRIVEVVDTPDTVARVLDGARVPPSPPPPAQPCPRSRIMRRVRA